MTSETSCRLHFGALQRGLDRDLAQLMRRHIGEGAVERADRRACARNDDDVFHQNLPSFLGLLRCRAKCRECEHR